ncbi:MAG: cobalamin B12-binding domain-containing protein [Spirochaetes bacterium]|nr:cobalamin B12-binding domain-containing protein [Spirochaetota bacterium]
MFTISRNAALDYQKKRTKLIEYVDDFMLNHPDIDKLVGAKGIDMMKINHQNHAAFISMILLLNRFESLTQSLPWVYRAYHNHGFSYDYFPVALNAWIEAIAKYLERDYADEIIPVYKWIIEKHSENIELSQQEKRTLYPIEEKWINVYERFFDSLMKGDSFKSVDIAVKSCFDERDVLEFYVNVAQPSLYRIGELWENGKITVAWEHLATAIVSKSIYHLSALFRRPFNEDKRALVLCITGEYHQLGALMVANCLEFDGWTTNFLADSLPFIDAMEHVASFKPDIIAISVTMQYNITPMIDFIKKIKDDKPDIKIIAGGQAFRPFPDLPQILGADGYSDSCTSAALLADKLISYS